jgi:hypothetical protein
MGWSADLPADLVEQLWRDPDALLAQGTKLQDKPRCTVVRLDHACGSFVFKRQTWGNLRRTLRRSLARSSARRSWDSGWLLAGAGIPTPLPQAYVERGLGPFSTCSYLLTRFVPGTSLYRLMRFERPSAELIAHLARQVAAIWQRLDELRICHNDLKTENLLVDPQGTVWLIDLERTRRYRLARRARRKQVRDAEDLLHPRNWRANPPAADVFRRAILQTARPDAALAGTDSSEHPLVRPAPDANRASQLVSVIIPCHNAAGTIAECIASVRDMADEILVADHGSSDDTLAIVRRLGGCRILQRASDDAVAFENSAAQAASHPWILRILPDEQLNPELGRQVQDLLVTEPPELGFRISRITLLRGHRLDFGGFPLDTSVRLFRKDAGRCVARDGRVEMLLPPGQTGAIASRLFFESCASVELRLETMIRQARQAALDAQQQGIRPSRAKILWAAPSQFLRSYFLRGGWLDGWAGLHACWLSALAVCLRETLLWELYEPNAAGVAGAAIGRQTFKVYDPNSANDSAAAVDNAPLIPGRPSVREERSAA